MSIETAPPASPSVIESTPETAVVNANRDATLFNLLGTDYEYAHTSGLLNNFYFDPETGEDAVMHVLGGDYLVADGGQIPRGFHHEPSGLPTWGMNAETGQARTYVKEVEPPEDSKKRRQFNRVFSQAPFNPYKAYVVVGDHAKKTVQKNPETGEVNVHENKNSMFPAEYDALAVLKNIVMARDSRDVTKDEIDLNQGVIIATGEVPMLDGQNKMQIKLFIDAESKKIKSAYPIVPRKKIEYTPDEVHAHLGLKNEQ